MRSDAFGGRSFLIVAGLVAAISLLAVGCGTDKDEASPAPITPVTTASAIIQVQAIDLEDAKQWNNSVTYTGPFPFNGYFSTGQTTVPKNRYVLLLGSATPPAGATVTDYVWTGLGTPTYLSGDTRQPYFKADTAGTYGIGMTATFSDGTSASATLDITAATFVGQSICASCHGEIYDNFQRTGSVDRMNHAQAWGDKTTGKRTVLSGVSCLKCHSVGYDYLSQGAGTNPDSFGWDDPSRHGGANDGSAWYNSAGTVVYNLTGGAGYWEQPAGSGIYVINNSLANQSSAQADLNGIQCENCHGPGSQHFGDPSKIGDAFSEKTCGAACHNRGHGGYDYEQSGHFKAVSITAQLKAECNPCHTARGFINVMDKERLAEDYTSAHGVTCAACHDPHNPTHPDMLRFDGEAEVSGVAVEAEVSAACVRCHTDENAAPGHSPYHPQAEMFYGTTLAGGKGYHFAGRTYSDMGHTAGVEEGCAECHMASTLMGTGKSDPGYPVTTLTGSIDVDDTTLPIGATSMIPLANGTLRIDNEQITYSAIATASGVNTVTVTARGANGTTAAAHTMGALITLGSGSRYRMGTHTWKVRDDVMGDDTTATTTASAWLAKKADNHYNVQGCNYCHRQEGAPTTTTTGTQLRTNLTGGLTLAMANSIAVADTTGFTAPGKVQIGGEVISYTALDISGTAFGDGTPGSLTRGAAFSTGPTVQAATANSNTKIAVVVPDFLNVVDTSAFPSSGVLYIEYDVMEGGRSRGLLKEKIYYTGKTATSFTGLLRGIDGTTGGMVQHPVGTTITLLRGVQVVLAPSTVVDHTTTLATALDATQTIAINIGNDTSWPAAGVVKIDSEFMHFTNDGTANQITITDRAQFGSAGAAHTVDATKPKVYLAAFSDTDTTMFVGTTGGPLPFPVPGLVKVNGEIIKYTGKTATSLTGLTRGLAGTMAVPHMQGEVAELQLFSPYAGDTAPAAMEIPAFQNQVVGMLATLEPLLPKDANGNVMISDTTMTDEQKGAAFNYYFVKNDGSHGLHNYRYAMQLLYDSIVAMGGTPPYSRP